MSFNKKRENTRSILSLANQKGLEGACLIGKYAKLDGVLQFA